MKKLLNIFFFLLIFCSINAQSIYIDNGAYISLKSGGNVYVKDTSISSIYSAGGGFYVPDTLGGFVEWNIQNNKGIYEVPFISNSDVYLPIILNISNGGVGTSIKFSTVDTCVKTYTSYYNANSINKYWNIDFSNFSTRPVGTVNLNYDVNDINYSYSDLIVKYYNNSSIWTDVPLATYLSGLAAFPISSYNSNKLWTLVNTSSPLPVTLLFFKGENRGNKYSHLTWETALEINNSGFIIERSLDAINFNYIGWVDGHGNSTVLNSYYFDDFNIEPGKTYYYRLKQVDYDGIFEYSNLISINFSDEIQKVEYYNLLGQKIDFDIKYSSGVYLKVINNQAKLFGVVK
jgi:hypothetical protein